MPRMSHSLMNKTGQTAGVAELGFMKTCEGKDFVCIKTYYAEVLESSL
jgi:hypothetical protein